MTMMGRKLRMKFEVSDTGKLEWFEGQITTYDGLNGKYRVYFPIDQQTIFISQNDDDVVYL